MRAVRVLATGPQVLVQDLGRPGYAQLGVPPSGALDSPALRLANRLVGNSEQAAGLELLLGGLQLRAESSCTVAVTGPTVPVAASGRAADTHTPVYLPPGGELVIGTPATGLRNYVAFSGGIAAPRELGSAATDVLSGIGPPPVRAGDVLPLGSGSLPPPTGDAVPVAGVPSELLVPLTPGPRDDWFTDLAAQLAGAVWRVSQRCNRIGLRADGPALRRAAGYRDELPSEAVLTGAVQVPPDGRPLIFLADHPTTGGYPVVGVVDTATLPALAQARPGTLLRLRLRSS